MSLVPEAEGTESSMSHPSHGSTTALEEILIAQAPVDQRKTWAEYLKIRPELAQAPTHRSGRIEVLGWDLEYASGPALATAIEQLDLMVEAKGEHRGVQEMRKHLVAYLRGFRGASQLRAELVRIDGHAAVLERLHAAMGEFAT